MKELTKEIATTQEGEDDIIQTETTGAQSLLRKLGAPDTEVLFAEVEKAKNLALATVKNIERMERHTKTNKWINFVVLAVVVVIGVAIIFNGKTNLSLRPKFARLFATNQMLLEEKRQSLIPREVSSPKESLDKNFRKTLATGVIIVAGEEMPFGIVVGGWSNDSIFLWLDKEIEKSYLDEISSLFPPWAIVEITPRESCRILVGRTNQYFYPDSKRSDHGFKYREAVDRTLTILNDLPSFRVKNVSYWTDY